MNGMDSPLSKSASESVCWNFKLLAHHELGGFGGMGEGMAVQVAKDGRRIIWLAHESAPKNFTAVDVTDPRKPKVVVQTDLPESFMRSNSLELSGDIMAVAYQTDKAGQKPAGIELFDVSVPEKPKSITYVDASAPTSRGVHQLRFCDGEFVHMAAGAPDFKPTNPMTTSATASSTCAIPRSRSKPVGGGSPEPARATTRRRRRGIKRLCSTAASAPTTPTSIRSAPTTAISAITITFGCSHEHSVFPAKVSLSQATLAAVVTDISTSLVQQGISALMVVNGHGGNYVLGNVVRQAKADGAMRVGLYPSREDWTEARRAAGITSNNHDDMHAGELETSILLAAHPAYLRDGWHTTDHASSDRRHLTTMGMNAHTTGGIIGYPSRATADKGQAVLHHLGQAAGNLIALLTK
jgi:creatinine amidohydrolase